MRKTESKVRDIIWKDKRKDPAEHLQPKPHENTFQVLIHFSVQ